MALPVQHVPQHSAPVRRSGALTPPAPRPSLEGVHFLTVDLGATDPQGAAASDQAMDLLLPLLQEHAATATFFVGADTATASAALVRRIAGAGHEVAALGPAASGGHACAGAFREHAARQRDTVEDVVGRTVRGYRAAGFSVAPGAEWMLEMLAAEGYEYDSSRAPVARPRPWWTPLPPYPHAVNCWAGRILELPLTSLWMAGMTVTTTASGMRHLPGLLTCAALGARAARGEPALLQLTAHDLVGGRRNAAGLLGRVLRTTRLVSIESRLHALRRVAPVG
jgi:hypothetical protein